jgi:Adenylate and Guanylate cyclase catalytic domain
MLKSDFIPELAVCYEEGKAVSGGFMVGPPGNMSGEDGYTQYFAGYLSTAAQSSVYYEGDPFSNIQFPIYGSFDRNDTKPVAMISAMVHWGSYLKGVLPNQAKGIIAIIENPCGGAYTFYINGGNVSLLGNGDLHDNTFDSFVHRTSFEDIERLDDGSEYGVEFLNTYCPVSLRVYPSQEFSDLYNTNLPIAITLTVLLVFVFSVVMFLLYDRLVERRQRLVLTKALHSSAIVSSLFPTKVAEQMLEQRDSKDDIYKNSTTSMHRLKSLLNHNEDSNGIPTYLRHEPIAELFPHTTVIFADIAGFTAWSSTREPTQVFTLLQGVYQGFDSIAKRRKVFKVETIGDSYVAVTGLPDPQEHHAIIMARFAAECQQKMAEVTGNLELHLGPGTRGT